MDTAAKWLGNAFTCAGILALGIWFGSWLNTGRGVKASSFDGADMQFQLTGISEDSSLLIYQPGTKTIYVYRAATTGNASLQCSFMFQLNRPGDTVRRVPCAIGNLMP